MTYKTENAWTFFNDRIKTKESGHQDVCIFSQLALEINSAKKIKGLLSKTT
jgi:hypothetical protein